MQKIIILIFFFPLLLTAQKKKKKEKEFYNSFGVFASKNIYTASFNKKKNNIYSVGIQMPHSILQINPRNIYRGIISYSFFLPQSIAVNDTLNQNLSGFNFSMDVLNLSLFKESKIIKLKFGVGFNTGQIKLKSENFTERNPYFSPMLSFYNGYIIKKRITTGFGAIYSYDVSSPQWRKTIISDQPFFRPQSLNQSCINFYLSVGWKF